MTKLNEQKKKKKSTWFSKLSTICCTKQHAKERKLSQKKPSINFYVFIDFASLNIAVVVKGFFHCHSVQFCTLSFQDFQPKQKKYPNKKSVKKFRNFIRKNCIFRNYFQEKKNNFGWMKQARRHFTGRQLFFGKLILGFEDTSKDNILRILI